jgi:hypothetical protein
MNSFRRTVVLASALVIAVGCAPSNRPAANPKSAPSAATAGVESAPAQSPGSPEAALVEAYKAAHASQNVESMLKLYWFGSADDEMRQTIRENVEAELRSPLKDIKIEPVAPGSYGPTVEGGIHWRPSLEVVAVLTANFDTSRAPPGELATQQIKLAIGRRGGKCYFTVPLRE